MVADEELNGCGETTWAGSRGQGCAGAAGDMVHANSRTLLCVDQISVHHSCTDPRHMLAATLVLVQLEGCGPSLRQRSTAVWPRQNLALPT